LIPIFAYLEVESTSYMKKTILVFLLLWISMPLVHAQQKTVHHLMVTIYESYGIGGIRALIETRDDGSQTRKKLRITAAFGIKNVMEHEDSLMLALKPYFDQGWEVTASTAIVASSEYTTRFFLRKEE
jgi:hypothetical protein